MAFTPYVTTDQVKEWITLTDDLDDVVIDEITEAVTQGIDEFCQRHFWPDGTVGSPVARTFSACCQWQLDLGPFNDLVSVSTLKTDEDGDGTFETTWSASDYQLCPPSRPTGRPYTRIEAVAGRLIPVRWGRLGRSDRVQVTGVWGWAEVPQPVVQAAKLLANRELNRRRSPEGVSAGIGEFGAVRISRQDPDVAPKLGPYEHPDTAVMVA